MPEPASNLIAAISGKAKPGIGAVDRIALFSRDNAGIRKTSFHAEFSKASDARSRSTVDADKALSARRDPLPKKQVEPSRNLVDTQHPIRKQADRHDSQSNASVAPRKPMRSEQADHSTVADNVSRTDISRHSSDRQLLTEADNGSEVSGVPPSHNKLMDRSITESVETHGSTSDEMVSNDAVALKGHAKPAVPSGTAISESLVAGPTGSGDSDVAGTGTVVLDEEGDAVPARARSGEGEATLSLLNNTGAEVVSATTSVLINNASPLTENITAAQAKHRDVNKAGGEARTNTIASQLQSLENIRSTAQAQSTSVSTSETADVVLQSALQSRYLLNGGLQVKGESGVKNANFVQNGLTHDIADSDAAATVTDASVKNLPMTSIAGLQVARLNQMAGKVAETSGVKPEATSAAVTDTLTHGEATPAMQKQLSSVVQSLSATADAQQFPTTVRDSVVNNTLAVVSGGIVTAPMVQRTDGGAGQVINAPATVPLLTPSAESGLVSNVRWMLGEGVKQAVVNVTPSGMGPISVQIGIEKEQMNVSIVATQGSTREALEALLPRLREQLTAQGHDSVRVDVSDGRSEQSRAGGGQQSDQFQQQTRMDDLAQQKNSASNSSDLADRDQQDESSEIDERAVSHDAPISFASHDEYVRHGRGVFDAYV